MSRSVWKGPFVDPILLKSSFRNKKSTFKHVWSRSSVIPFSLLGQSVLVHNGKLFKKGNKRTKRYECTEISTGRMFLFQPNAEVELIKS